AAGTEGLKNVVRAELRPPRIVERAEVVLAGLVLRVGEELLERHAVLVFEERDVEALLLGGRDDLLLERRQAAVGERADDHLAAVGARGRGPDDRRHQAGAD